MPILLIYLTINLKSNVVQDFNNYDDKPLIENLRDYSDTITPGVGTDFSSGRIDDWNKIINKNENVFLEMV